MAIEYPPSTPMSSLGRELGIMFAFIGAGLVTMAIYTFAWKGLTEYHEVVQRKNLAQDLDRRKAFHSRTAPAADTRLLGSPTAVSHGRSERIAEKMLDRYAVPTDRAELPVHGMEMGQRSSGQSQGQTQGQGQGLMNGNGNGHGGEGFDFGFGAGTGTSGPRVVGRDLL
ncbi:hypothetical protein N7481_008085 [Penicillium waksmanii]|uniref:uncharacterized protein n=1 Tax=Penicillium waksmanii TaxID=69791 RepID=UPI0025486764|nr:uncharacterized protein N7481_008085 [Penicillium waksmanii]KAJ5980787.1 hypothetical protein N7481_008085 [Penicillium waksmanii]